MAYDMDILVMSHYVLRKVEQPATVTAVSELGRCGDGLVCAETGHEFAVTDNIPRLF